MRASPYVDLSPDSNVVVECNGSGARPTSPVLALVYVRVTCVPTAPDARGPRWVWGRRVPHTHTHTHTHTGTSNFFDAIGFVLGEIISQAHQPVGMCERAQEGTSLAVKNVELELAFDNADGSLHVMTYHGSIGTQCSR